MKTTGLWEAAKRGAMAQLVDLEVERTLLEKLIAKCDAQLGVQSTSSTSTHKGRRYTRNGLHWTQKPENKAKLRRALRKMWRAR